MIYFAPFFFLIQWQASLPNSILHRAHTIYTNLKARSQKPPTFESLFKPNPKTRTHLQQYTNSNPQHPKNQIRKYLQIHKQPYPNPIFFKSPIKITKSLSPEENLIQVKVICKVVIYNYVFCWLLFRAKFDCNFIQSVVPCIYCGI